MRSESRNLAPEDTEITLGAGKMLGLFFGLVLLCAVFFGMGFSMGKNSATPAPVDSSLLASAGASRPAAVKAGNLTPPAAAPSKSAGQKDASSQLDPPDSGVTTIPPANAAASSPDAGSPPSVTGYYVQVAAVSKQEDAESLIDALKKKQYPAFSATTPTDKLFHVQVGPFSDIKQAELVRANLLHDGYNPILKK